MRIKRQVQAAEPAARDRSAWWTVIVAMLFQLMIIGSTISAFGLYVIPVSSELGLSRAQMNTGLIITNLGGAVMAPVLGRLIDIYPAHRIISVCAFLFCLGLIGLGLSQSVLLSAAILALAIPAGPAGVSQLGGITLVARQFSAQRSRAMALTMMGASLGSLVIVPIAGWLIAQIGWRNCLIVIGGSLLVLIHVLVLTLRNLPVTQPRPVARHRARSDTATPGAFESGREATRELLTQPRFWLAAVSVALAMAALQAMMISLAPIALEGGASLAKSASLISVLGAAALISKVALVWVGDRIDKPSVLAVMFAALTVTFVALAYSQSFGTLVICSALLGLGVGATTPVFLALVADYVRPSSFGLANGIALLLTLALGAIGMRFGGEVYDRTGGYDLMFLAAGAICMIATGLMATCRRLGPREFEFGGSRTRNGEEETLVA